MDDAFWAFSNAVYEECGVRDECLALQERWGLDVNLVLFCAYAGAVHGISLTEDDIATAQREVAPWHEEVVKSLRAARRKLKPFELKPDRPFAKRMAQLRTQVKAVEIDSEHIEQCMLEAVLQKRLTTSSRHRPDVALMHNLQSILKLSRTEDEEREAPAMERLITAALKHGQ